MSSWKIKLFSSTSPILAEQIPLVIPSTAQPIFSDDASAAGKLPWPADEVDKDVEHWKEMKLLEIRQMSRLADAWKILTLFLRASCRNNMMEKMESQFIRKAAEIFSLSEADGAKLPSLKAWKERRQL